MSRYEKPKRVHDNGTWLYCPPCARYHPPERFGLSNRSKDGRQSWCKQSKRDREKNRRGENKEASLLLDPPILANSVDKLQSDLEGIMEKVLPAMQYVCQQLLDLAIHVEEVMKMVEKKD